MTDRVTYRDQLGHVFYTQPTPACLARAILSGPSGPRCSSLRDPLRDHHRGPPVTITVTSTLTIAVTIAMTRPGRVADAGDEEPGTGVVT